jgi:hypothetical protein
VWLFGLHQTGAIAHLLQRHAWGDACFVVFLLSLLLALVARFRSAQLGLTAIGLMCGMAGAGLLMLPATNDDPGRFRLANLLLDQGFLLGSLFGLGIVLFPSAAVEGRMNPKRVLGAGLVIVGSFFLEAWGEVLPGYALRLVAAAHVLREIRWGAGSPDAPQGTLGTGVHWALGSGGLGLALAGFFYPQHVSVEHLLYIGGFGLLILLVASRVMFEHGGDLDGARARSGWVRFFIVLAILAAATRSSPAWAPRTTVSHHIYAACAWAILGIAWIIWHRRRFLQGDRGMIA